MVTRLLVIIGTRPEAIKLSPVIRALRHKPGLAVHVCVTGQHPGLVETVLTRADIIPDIDFGPMPPGQALHALMARLLRGLGALLESEAPDRVIVQGDTASALAGAMAAHHRQVPVAHVEAGLRSGNPRHPWPEETNRRLIGAIADLHFAPTLVAAEALRREGVAPAGIHMTGNSGIDALLDTQASLRAGNIVSPAVSALAMRFAGKRILAVTAHRRENWGAGMAAIARALRQLAARDDIAIILPLHPNPAVRAPFQAALADRPNVALIEPLDHAGFVALLDACHIVLTDSGGIQEEAPALGKPVLVLRETTERPEGVTAGTARLVGTDSADILAQTLRLLDEPGAYAAMARAHSPYGDGRAAARIADCLAPGGA